MQRKWYMKKRYWLLSAVLLLYFISRLAVLEMRYQPEELAQSIATSSFAPFTYKRKVVAGTTMHYGQLGTSDTLPIVLLVHGSPGSMSAYEVYLKDSLLNQRANLIVVDRLGFGYSDFGTAVPSLELQAKLIAAILKDFPNNPKIIVGHSMGGPVNSRLVMDYPDLINGMVLVAPSISPALEPSNGWRKLLNFPLFRWVSPPALRVCNQEIIPLKEELLEMEHRWKNIECPVTIIQGVEDKLVPKGNAFFAKEQLTNSRDVQIIMIDGGNHFILWSEVPLIRTAILDMLDNL